MEDVGDKQKLTNWLETGSVNIFGRPFSCKDTQARALSQLFNAPIIGGGDIIRNSGHKNMNDHINTGKLTPQKEYLDLVLPFLSKSDYRNLPLILSSLGRWHGEEESIMQATQASGHTIKAVIYLDIDEDTVIKRWEVAKKLGDRGSRNDDNADSIKIRLNEFRNKTLPVLEFYKQRGLLININGNLPRDQVSRAVSNALLQKAS